MTQENPIVEQPAAPADEGSGKTQVGQVLRDLSRMTTRLPRRKASREGRYDAAVRERLALLMNALGDPTHPQHGGAVDELARLGDVAVPTLVDALSHSSSWLVSYRAAEALGQIGDGRATNALMAALSHANSNVRWSAVRALAQIGDARSMFALRRVARTDRGKTTWGEPVSGAAQGALDQMQAQSMLLRGADLVKTALACVLMLVALIVCFSVVGELRATWQQIGDPAAVPAAVVRRVRPTAAATAVATAPAASEPAAAAPTSAPAAAPNAPAPTDGVAATAQLTSNVREKPEQGSTSIGEIAAGDQIVVLGVTEDGLWYKVRLSSSASPNSKIDGGQGWVFSALVSALDQQPPVAAP